MQTVESSQSEIMHVHGSVSTVMPGRNSHIAVLGLLAENA